jgi:hypothetical protein
MISMAEEVTKEPKKLDPNKLSESIEKMETLEYPSKKSREKALADIPSEYSKETIPPEIKKELTEEARRKHNLMGMEGQGEKTELPKVKPFVEEKPVPVATESPKPPVIESGDETPLEKIKRLKAGIPLAEPTTPAERAGKAVAEEEVRKARERAERKEQFGVPSDSEYPYSFTVEKPDVRAKSKEAAKPPISTRRPEQQPEPKEPGFLAKLLGKKE